MGERRWDVLAMGRSSIDLYANDIGAPFPQIRSFAAYVGGCPTNISVGTRRLGLRSALLTAIGDDPVGDFVLAFLNAEGVETGFVARKPGRRTSAVLLGIEPPDRFPLVFYRDNCADIAIDVDDVLGAPLGDARLVLITGTGLSAEPSRSATLYAAELAASAGAAVFVDLDLRPTLWHDPRAFGPTLRSALRCAEAAIGTEEEVCAAAGADGIGEAVRRLQDAGARTVVVKQGARGSTVFDGAREMHADPFPVDVCNVLGAGDAFASGLIYGFLRGWDWHRAARMGNACGAIVVTRHGCANFMPYEQETLDFVRARGGF
ncbi:MAG: 5-dehydro-2-deoxygluconokinase [Armatimonadota bacterium]|nr:5-dehydro-2-deoxygluconokinase [Armatimonadota bacterium]MDR5697423.1 5-dehydro-2-deoxygluconokinase [Armatimonadota bacterium]